MPPLIDPPLVIAHAGGAGPENTMAAIRASLAAGVQALEVDVWCTSDGTPVLLHDQTLDRTTNGTGNITDLTLVEAQALDAGDGERIPTLVEALAETRGRARLNIEVKQEGIASEVVAAVRGVNAARDVWISSFSTETIEAAKWIAPEIERSLLFMKIREDASEFILYNLSNFILGSFAPLFEFVRANPLFVEVCHKRGVPVYTWTVDGAHALEEARSLEVDGVFTDDVALALELYRVPELAVA
ncbi:MAG: glycerophosphodiester phosphodiesterase family protein [Dehalococcoidia bacterium]